MEKQRVDAKAPGECCGCTACESICPKDAITMQPDALGFLYPHIDEEKCINCGLCMKVCSFKKGYPRTDKFEQPLVYAARLRDTAQLARSQSGGMGYALSRAAIGQGAIVYGVGFGTHFRAVHKRVDRPEGLEELRGSKYVQSDLRGIFPQVKRDLKDGHRVLFFGTPCQVAGLTSYIGKQLSEKLFTADLVCHGCPSPAVWDAYVSYLGHKEGSKILEAKFRDKSFGWASHHETFLFATGKKKTSITFRMLFYAHYMLRPSCHQCPFTNLERCSDLTIGDFWGWQKVSRRFNDNRGVSLVLVNSEKGQQLLDEIRPDIELAESNTRDCLQPQLQAPTTPHPLRERFVRDFTQRGFLYVARRYANLGWRYKLSAGLSKGKRLVKKIIRR